MAKTYKMISEIDLVQSSLIKKSKKYLNDCKKKDIDIALSPFCDLTTWIKSLGYQKLHLINKNKLFSKDYAKYLLPDIINIGRYKFEYFSYINNLLYKKK